MELHQIKCPGCNATLNVEDDLDSFYCKYCGSKIIMTGRDKEVIRGKVKIKLAQEENKQKHFEIEERYKQKRYEVDAESKDKHEEKMVIIAFLAVILLGLLLINFPF